MRFAALTVLLASSLLGIAQSIPETQGKALDDTPVIFPQKGDSRPLIIMIGFSHKSSQGFDAWNKKILSSYLSDPKVVYYEVANLQGVPSFVRGMILHGMRRTVPKPEHPHFLPIFSAEEEWKKAAGFSDPNAPYVLVADATGKIVWQTHGMPTESSIAECKETIAKLIAVP